MHPLDNVIWHALTTRQAQLAEGGDQARRFPREVTTLAAFFEPSTRGYASLAGILDENESVSLWSVDPLEPPARWEVVMAYPGLQMVYEDDVGENSANPSAASKATELGASDSHEMVELATLTKPGPFGPRTHELGTYLGIRREGKLIAMAGERLRVPGYTEVSAVCTHPEHLGKGYAGQLMRQVMELIRERGEIPFLHVRQSNARAISLYERLGFRTRLIVQFTVLRKAQVAS